MLKEGMAGSYIVENTKNKSRRKYGWHLLVFK